MMCVLIPVSTTQERKVQRTPPFQMNPMQLLRESGSLLPQHVGNAATALPTVIKPLKLSLAENRKGNSHPLQGGA